MDEIYIHSSHTNEKGWSDDTKEEMRKSVAKGLCTIIINSGGEVGFMPGAYARWKSDTNSGDYHHEINYENFEKWVIIINSI